MKKLDFFQVKKRFEKNYAVLIAVLSSVLSYFSFLFQFKDSFKGWNIVWVALTIFLSSVLAAALITYLFFLLVRRKTLLSSRKPYSITESKDICEFTDESLTKALYKRVEKVMVHNKEIIPVYYKLPTVSPGIIQNVSCHVNGKDVLIHEEMVHSEKYLFHHHNGKETKEFERVWQWEAVEVFKREDDIKITSSPSLEKCLLKVILNKPSRDVKAESYVYQTNDRNAVSVEEFAIQDSASVTVIERNFDTYLDGGIYKFGIHWKIQ